MGGLGVGILVLAGARLTIHQVKRIYVAQRENPIVNRLNKTKVERKPDLKQEKDDREKVLRRRQQSAQQERVSPFHFHFSRPRVFCFFFKTRARLPLPKKN